MMNIIKVQDSLKNFSEDQLIKEMQQPTGNAPQFLVLSELNRRKRVKGDFEARQAENQPTVAEEAVAAAGVPQDQMMGMPEAMAPQSAVSEGVGTSAPMKMATGGLAQFGQEIRSGMGQDIDPYLDGVQNEAEQKFGVQLGQLGQGNMNIQPSIYQQPMHRGPSPGYRGPSQFAPQDPRGPRIPDSMGGIGGKGMPRPAVMPREYLRGDVPFRGGAEMKYTTTSMADGGVVRAANGLPDGEEESSYGDDFLKYIKGIPGSMYDTGNAALDFISPRIQGDLSPNKDDNFVEDAIKGSARGFNSLVDLPGDIAKGIYSGAKGVTDQFYNIFAGDDEEQIDSGKIDDSKTNEEQTSKGKNYVIQPSNTAPSETSSIENDIIELQKANEKERQTDKWMAIAQAGLGILASESPTLAGAVGEGAGKGLQAFNDANQRYKEGVVDLINARSKIAEARATSASKGQMSANDLYNKLNKVQENIYGKMGDYGYNQGGLQGEALEKAKAEEVYLRKKLQEFGVDIPITQAS
jgi:hypothetical protein